MIKYHIYQIRKKSEGENYSFMGWKFATDHGFDLSHYDNVYSGNISSENNVDSNELLEDIFTIFNVDHPSDFRGHSLSVSDIVALDNGTTTLYFYCDSFGWKDITDIIA